MATATKNYYYVLVFTIEGPKYVTSTEDHYAHWDSDKKPMVMSAHNAKGLMTALSFNGFNCVVTKSHYPLTEHPYLYEHGSFRWIPNGFNFALTEKKVAETKA